LIDHCLNLSLEQRPENMAAVVAAFDADVQEEEASENYSQLAQFYIENNQQLEQSLINDQQHRYAQPFASSGWLGASITILLLCALVGYGYWF